MPKNLHWRLAAIGLILAVGIYWFVFPEERGKPWFSRLNLGLDLKGGVHLILQVVTDDALNQEVNQVAERITAELRTRGIAFAASKKAAGFSVEVTGVDLAKDKDARQFLESSGAPFLTKPFDLSEVRNVVRRRLMDTATAHVAR